MFQDLEKYESLVSGVAPTEIGDLDPRLCMFKDENIEVWFAPLGQQPITPDVWILGITPGWHQMRIAYEGAADLLNSGKSQSEASNLPKPNVAFAGSMRTNLIDMLDGIGLHIALSLPSSKDLFGSGRLRTGSVLRFPVFKNGKNYTGSSPSPLNHPFMKEMVDSILVKEIELVGKSFIVPLGKSVELVLSDLVQRQILDPRQILNGFPHPSGANGHRVKTYKKNREQLTRAVESWFRS